MCSDVQKTHARFKGVISTPINEESMNLRLISSIFSLFISVSVVHAVEVTKDSWVESMTTAIPTYFCQTEQYFRQCFDVSAVKCEEVAVSSTRICIAKTIDQIPNTLHQPKDGTKWGTVVGTCVGQSYEISLIKSKIRNSKCNDANNWK